MIVLDLGCGQATISMGVSEVVPHGRVLGVDIDRAGLAAARGDAATIGCGNIAFAAADGRQLPFRSGVFDAVLCHSILETLSDPRSVVTEVRRVIGRGGVVGAASGRWEHAVGRFGGIFEDRVLAWRRVVPLARLCHMRQACNKMEIGGVADRRLRLVRHQFDPVCLRQCSAMQLAGTAAHLTISGCIMRTPASIRSAGPKSV
jgi:SAM-dependent methyltransferase